MFYNLSVFGLQPAWNPAMLRHWGIPEQGAWRDELLAMVKQDIGIEVMGVSAHWDLIEKSQGEYDWGWMERQMAFATKWASPPKVTCLITSLPPYILPPGSRQQPHQGPIPSRAYPRLEEFCYRLAQRYKGITNYHFWNEPLTMGGVNWQIPDYFAAFEVAGRGLKRGNPQAKLWVGGLDGDFALAMRQYYELPNRPAIDGVTIHPYASSGQYDTPLQIGPIDDLHHIMQHFGDGDKKVYVGEWGWANLPEDTQAEWVEDGLSKLSTRGFIAAANYHTLNDFDPNFRMGLVEAATHFEQGLTWRKKAAYHAFQRVAQKTRLVNTVAWTTLVVVGASVLI